jgi:uncharacterized membrane-anchored protein
VWEPEEGGEGEIVRQERLAWLRIFGPAEAYYFICETGAFYGAARVSSVKMAIRYRVEEVMMSLLDVEVTPLF